MEMAKTYETSAALDCLFVVPPYTSGKASTFKAFEYAMPPLGVLYIAAYLRQNGYTVNLLDFAKQNSHTDDELLIESFQKTYKTIHYIGVSICTPAAYNAYKLIALFKKYYPDAKIMAGGPHVIGIKEAVFAECPLIDYAIDGEGEIPVYKLLSAVALNEIPGLIYKKGTEVISIPNSTHTDLSTLPLPAIDLIDFRGYGPRFSSVSNPGAMAGLFASRGCPFKCTFCTRVTGNTLRFSPVEHVIAQIKLFKNNFGIGNFIFYDDTFTAGKKYLMEVCKSIIEQTPGISWICHGRADTIDEEMLDIMKKAGCKSIYYGVESLDEEVLASVKKGISTAQIKRAIKLTRKARIEVKISVILGLPADTLQSIEHTGKEMLKLGANYVMLFIMTPFPGSEIYTQAKKENKLLSENWNHYNLSHYVYKHDIFTEKDILLLQKKMYKMFYFRGVIFINFIKTLRSWSAFRALYTGFLGFLKLLYVKKN